MKPLQLAGGELVFLAYTAVYLIFLRSLNDILQHNAVLFRFTPAEKDKVDHPCSLLSSGAHLKMSSSSFPGYVTLEAGDGHRVVLPCMAAARSRVLAYLFKGLVVMETHRRQHRAEESCAAGEGKRQREDEEQEVWCGKSSHDHCLTSGEEETDGSKYRCFAHVDGAPSSVLQVVVPLPSITSRALVHVAKYLVMICSNGSDPLSEMNQNSQEDIERVTELMRAADLLQC